MEKKFTFSIDVDNTIYEEQYPRVGPLIDGAKETINWLYDNGHTIIIDTCRTGAYAEDAMAHMDRDGIKYHYFNNNDPRRITQYGNDSRKISADINIDDKNIESLYNGEVVDWKRTRQMLNSLIFPKPLIVCIVGESGVGKSYLADYLKENYDIPMIESYTDRPRRHKGEEGHTFLKKEEFDDLNMKDMIAFTAWPDGQGGVTRYCCMESDVTEDVCCYVIDERGLKYLRKYWSHKFRIFAVRLFAPDHERAKRATPERMARDEGLFTLTDQHFDLFIDNDYTSGMNKKYDALYERIQKL